MKKLFITIFLSLSLIVSPIDALAYSGKPVNSYTGPSGVTIRSFTSSYSSLDKLKGVYNELMKNAIGEEIKYLSHIDLVGDYPYGEDTGGMWYGEWENNKLEKGRYFEIFGADTITFTELAKVLSHEYGHHFTYYHLNKGEQIDSLNIMESGFSDIRKLKSYKSIDNDIHSWSPAEIAAEDYVQLFGSSTGKESVIFKDVRDYLDSGSSNDTAFSSLIYNLYPQENFSLPLAWQIEGYYQYWSKLSGVSIPYNRPPSAPLLGLTEIDGGSHTLTWTKSLDDRTEDIEYTVVYTRDEDTEAVGGIRTTTDSNGRDAIIGTYERGRMTAKDNVLSSKVRVRVYAKDEDGNIVASNDLVIDPENPQNSLTKPVERIAGLNRYETSAAISRAGWEGNSDYAVLATGENFPDALSAAPLAKKYNAPILLTGRAKLDKKVDMELKRLKVKNVFIVGGTGVISSEVETYLKDEGLNTTRIYGSNRYETSVEVAKH